MSKTLPVVFIVPGAFHTAYHFRKVVQSLEGSGLKAVVHKHPIPGEWQGETTFDSLVIAIQRAIQEELDQGYDVLVVAHSAGGLSAMAALEGLVKSPDRHGSGIIGLFAISAVLEHESQSCVDILKGACCLWYRIECDFVYSGDWLVLRNVVVARCGLTIHCTHRVGFEEIETFLYVRS